MFLESSSTRLWFLGEKADRSRPQGFSAAPLLPVKTLNVHALWFQRSESVCWLISLTNTQPAEDQGTFNPPVLSLSAALGDFMLLNCGNVISSAALNYKPIKKSIQIIFQCRRLLWCGRVWDNVTSCPVSDGYCLEFQNVLYAAAPIKHVHVPFAGRVSNTRVIHLLFRKSVFSVCRAVIHLTKI